MQPRLVYLFLQQVVDSLFLTRRERVLLYTSPSPQREECGAMVVEMKTARRLGSSFKTLRPDRVSRRVDMDEIGPSFQTLFTSFLKLSHSLPNGRILVVPPAQKTSRFPICLTANLSTGRSREKVQKNNCFPNHSAYVLGKS